MNESIPSEMTKEEIRKLLDEYRDENVRLEIERDTYKHALEILTRRIESAPKHKTVADFKLINLTCKYKDGSSGWYSATEYLSRLTEYEGYEPYGYIQNTEKGPVQAMIKYKEES